jgi:His-Xaa-Ser system protein HxsD
VTSTAIRFDGASATVEVDTTIYSVTALKKAAYRLADRCFVQIGVPEGTKLWLDFRSVRDEGESAVRGYISSFFDEALDYDLRERVSGETAQLRNLILAHAFSRTKLVQGSGG